MATVAVLENRGGSSVLPRYRLTSREKAHVTSALRDLLEFRKEVLFAYLHGSFVNGSRFRDIDVAVYLDHGRRTRRASLQYQVTLAKDLSRALHLPVDVTVLNVAPLGLRHDAVSGRVLLCREDRTRVHFADGVCRHYEQIRKTARHALFTLLWGHTTARRLTRSRQ
ncbi:MAG: nucleotidyltransferase domain-containing protein [Candidatus Methylomirabilales bacterium]